MNNVDPAPEAVAVVGMAGRFPGAADLGQYWQNLRDGVESIAFFTDAELQEPPLGEPTGPDDPPLVKARGVLDRPEWFDAAFFNLSPREAALTDPQHRVFLETAWSALENAGYNPGSCEGSVGVFAGASLNTYLLTHLSANGRRIAPFGAMAAMLGNDKDFLPLRVSYKLNLRGPSVNVQTACSTSLVAVCLAAQSLLDFHCDVALAGGVSIAFPQKQGWHYDEGGILSPDGHCRPFDADGAGTVPGDGAGVVVLKRLSEALAEGDTVLAVVKGCAVNNDGARKMGFTAPSVDGQAEVVAQALAVAGAEPETISYIEAHGTATPLGDPIEIAGLTKAFGASSNGGAKSCSIGSVKGNIGHLDAASGVAGLIKTILALRHRQIPPSLHFRRPNPKIEFTLTPFQVNDHLREWLPERGPLRAGVSSFGIGGTNAHVVLEEAPDQGPSGQSRPIHLLVVSAKTKNALDQAAADLAEHLETHPQACAADVAFTLQLGRKPLAHRRIVVCGSVAEAARLIRKGDGTASAECQGEASPVAFLFPGQGAHRAGMGRQLYESEPVFRDNADRSCEILQRHLEIDFRGLLYGAPGKGSEGPGPALPTLVAQPAMFVTEFALAQLWMSWGIRPQVMAGHSLGEYAAACISGVFSLEDALAAVAARARLMQEQPPGAMLAVSLSESDAMAFMEGGLSLAAINGPLQCVISGPIEAINALEERLSREEIASRRLPVSLAFHSAMMEPALPKFTAFLRTLTLHAPRIPFASNVTGTWITTQEATDPEYWAAHMRRTVRFSDGLAELGRGASRTLLEVGPGRTLFDMARREPRLGAPGRARPAILSSLGCGTDSSSEISSMLDCLGRLWLWGSEVDWRGLHAHEHRRRVPLPTYPFERKRFSLEPSESGPASGTIEARPAQEPAGRNGSRGPGGLEPGGACVPGPTNGSGCLPALEALFAELSGAELPAGCAAASFFELGLDSLFLTQASRAVQRRFGASITFRQLTEELSSLDKLAAHLDRTAAVRAGKNAAPEPAGVGAVREGFARWAPLTEGQREIWFAAQMGAAASAGFNQLCILRLRGPCDVPALRCAWRQLVDRHEALRTTIESSGERQRIAAAAQADVAWADLSGETGPGGESAALQFIGRDMELTFDLVKGPLWRAHLLKLADQDHWLALVLHHIVCDGWTLGLFARELGELYSACLQGRPSRLPPSASFGDYADQEAGMSESAEAAAAEAYWRGQFANPAPDLDLPADRPRPTARTYAGARQERAMTPAATAAVRRLCGENGCTAFTLLLSVFGVLLHRLSGQDDIVIGFPVAAQVFDGRERLAGHGVNLLPFRSRLAEEQSFRAYLSEVRQAVWKAFEHWQCPFGRLIRQLRLPRDRSRAPLVGATFNLGRVRGALPYEGLEVEVVPGPRRFVNFDLGFDIIETDKAFIVHCNYSTELFDDATIARLISLYERLLEEAGARPDEAVAALPLVGEAERRQMLVEWNGASIAYPRDWCVDEAIAAQAVRTPEATAVVWGTQTLTYSELERRAGRLAARLRARGMGPERLAGVCLERTPEMLVAILAVLKTGGAYVPLDPSYPVQRLAAIADDSGMPILLTQRSLLDRIPNHRDRALCLDGDEGPDPPDEATRAARSAADLAYVIYTSGSTGKPKGVAIEHRSVVALIAWAHRNYEPQELAGVLAATSICFDLSVFEMFVPLCAGGKVILADTVLNLPTLPAADQVTLINTVPSAIAELVRLKAIPPSVRTINLAGEFLPQNLVELLYRHSGIRRVFDLYGPTEDTVYSTFVLRRPGGAPTIGRPLPNKQAYILDRRRQPVPIGMPGELWLGGDGLARGYWGLPERTGERFIANPFRSGGRIYRTGDLARYRSDGEIEYLGRLDHQVKLRGYRIELGEIESALRRHPEVRDCVAIVREDRPNDPRLVAYVATDSRLGNNARDLRLHLERMLPGYMVPSEFVVLTKLPLTLNGKVDRKSLPRPESGQPGAGAEEELPATPTENALAAIWRDVLQRESVGRNDNFFDLGGHSLLATRLIARIEETFGAELPLRAAFDSPVLGLQAAVVEEAVIARIDLMGEEDAALEACVKGAGGPGGDHEG